MSFLKNILWGLPKPNQQLLEAASSCNVNGVSEALTDGADVNTREPTEGQTPLLLCLRSRSGPSIGTARQLRALDDIKRVFDLLLKSGANVNSVDNDGESPLHWAVGYCFTDIVRALLKAGAKVNVIDNQGYTPLIQLAGIGVAMTPQGFVSPNGHTEIAHLLIEAGADVNARTREGQTVLYFAKGNRHSELVQLLVKNGATV